MASVPLPLVGVLRGLNTADLLKNVVLHLEKAAPARDATSRDGIRQAVDDGEGPVHVLDERAHVGSDEEIVGDLGAKV